MIKIQLLKFASLAILFGCAQPHYKRPDMLRPARVEYVTIYGWNLIWPQRVAYREGRIIPGMRSELVEILYGEPDLTILGPKQNLLIEKIWVYQYDGKSVGSVSLQADTVVKVTGQLAEACRF